MALAALPVIELRGAVPLGLALGLNPAWVYVLAVSGNMLPIPFVYRLLLPVRRRLGASPRIQQFVERYLNRLLQRSGTITKYGFWGLVVFVAVPLPGTGAWTGAIAASLLGIRFRPAMVALTAGTMLAGVVVLVLAFLGGALVGQVSLP
jgi:uncharacterized membrane protein